MHVAREACDVDMCMLPGSRGMEHRIRFDDCNDTLCWAPVGGPTQYPWIFLLRWRQPCTNIYGIALCVWCVFGFWVLGRYSTMPTTCACEQLHLWRKCNNVFDLGNTHNHTNTHTHTLKYWMGHTSVETILPASASPNSCDIAWTGDVLITSSPRNGFCTMSLTTMLPLLLDNVA